MVKYLGQNIAQFIEKETTIYFNTCLNAMVNNNIAFYRGIKKIPTKRRLKTMLNFNHKEIKQGDFVNFGAYGSFYVCRIDESFGI